MLWPQVLDILTLFLRFFFLIGLAWWTKYYTVKKQVRGVNQSYNEF